MPSNFYPGTPESFTIGYGPRGWTMPSPYRAITDWDDLHPRRWPAPSRFYDNLNERRYAPPLSGDAMQQAGGIFGGHYGGVLGNGMGGVLLGTSGLGQASPTLSMTLAQLAEYGTAQKLAIESGAISSPSVEGMQHLARARDLYSRVAYDANTLLRSTTGITSYDILLVRSNAVEADSEVSSARALATAPPVEPATPRPPSPPSIITPGTPTPAAVVPTGFAAMKGPLMAAIGIGLAWWITRKKR